MGRTVDARELPSLSDWKEPFFQELKNWCGTIDMAIAGGFIGDRLAYAFAGGYFSALRCLIPSLPAKRIGAFCVTEAGGNHPKGVKTKLVSDPHGDKTDWLLSGFKSYVTCVDEADYLLIAASIGISASGQNMLRLVRIENPAPGLLIKPLEDLPFIPEIRHGELKMDRVHVAESQILPGDAYPAYIKPFRTLEDFHITAAVSAYLFRTACLFKWPQDIKERILALLSCIKAVSTANPMESALHILCGGISGLFASVIDSIEPHMDLTDAKTCSRWHRDKAFFNIAEKAREKRLSAAWAHYES